MKRKKERPLAKWQRITHLARQAPRDDEPDADVEVLPFGQSTRIAAAWSKSRNPSNQRLDLMERAGWYGAALAVTISVVCVINYDKPSVSSTEERLAFDAFFFAPQSPQNTSGSPNDSNTPQ